MPVIDNKYVGGENIDYAPSNLDIKHENLSDIEISRLIDSMCSARSNNQDVQVMERVNNDRQFIDPILQEKLDLESDMIAVEDSVIMDIMRNGGTDGMSIEEINSLKATNAYNRYVQRKREMEDIDVTSDIEAELIENLKRSAEQEDAISKEAITEIISEEQFQEDESVKEDNNSNETEVPNNDQESTGFDAEKVNNIPVANGCEAYAMDETRHPKKEEDTMDVEDINDVPITEIDISDNEAIDALKKKYADVNMEDALQLVNVMRRFKNKEKFNVFEALPNVLKKEILKQAAEVGADKSTVNFFAKTFINDLINDTYFDREFQDFNQQLNEAMAPMSNVVGSVMDEYNDEVYDKFTTGLLNKAEEIRANGDDEKATEVELIAKRFDEAVQLKLIKDAIANSHINRAYKTARDGWNNILYDYNQAIMNVKPAPRNLNECVKGLVANGVPEDYAKTIVYYVKNEVVNNIAKKSLPDHVYSYYLTDSIEKLGLSAKTSKTYKMTMETVNKCVELINAAMTPLKSRNSKKNRRRNNRRK